MVAMNDNNYLIDGKLKQQAYLAGVLTSHLDRMSQNCWNSDLYLNQIEFLEDLLFPYRNKRYDIKITMLNEEIEKSQSKVINGVRTSDKKKTTQLMREKLRAMLVLAHENNLLPTKTVEGTIRGKDVDNYEP